ncbi:MAG: cytidylate kinase-like family protein [Lachnospiraceae bacterium]|nr:cytidylate kinase-like family protein [Lachnospiraceae bacterium]
MANHKIITIGRQFGSGGHEIGQLLAEHYGIKCYDNDLLTVAAKESGLCEEIFKTHDEKPTNSFLYSLVVDSYFGYGAGLGMNEMPLGQQVFLAQFDTIRKIAKNEDCIFVGRCADYALRDDYDVTSVFITSDDKSRIDRICKRHNVSAAKAREMMLKTDKKRASYYNYYSDKRWGNSSSYDLCINSGKIGIENTVKLIVKYNDMKSGKG